MNLSHYIIIIFSFLLEYAEQKAFRYIYYNEIMETFTSLAKSCPQYIRIDSAQNRYGLPYVNGCGDEKDKPCENLIVFMTDFASYTTDRPHFYVSGLVHGDEQTGPTSLTELALFFCNNKDHQSRAWVFNILKKRLFILTPMTNAYGFSNEIRGDAILSSTGSLSLIDPNRDFPYFSMKQSYSRQCMQTITARTVNELHREHIIVASITFHAGNNLIGYQWGTAVHTDMSQESTEAPDHNALVSIGKIMQKFSWSEKNGNKNITNFALKDMTSFGLTVEGGMEDWAYAGSWENNINPLRSPIKVCKPLTFGGYREDKTKYDDTSLRSLTFIVEAGIDKKPQQADLGNDEEIFDISNQYFGYVPRNMRVIISAADLIYSYININNIFLQENKLSYTYTLMGCEKVKSISHIHFYYNNLNEKIPSSSSNTKFGYNLNLFKNFNTMAKSIAELFIDGSARYFSYLNVTKTPHGENVTCFWGDINGKAPVGTSTVEIDLTRKMHIRKEVSLNSKNISGIVSFVLGEHPDPGWGDQGQPDPNVPPQSHAARIKAPGSDETWKVKNKNFVLYSSYYFMSNPVILFENGIAVEVDDSDALFFQSDDIYLLASIYTNITDISEADQKNYQLRLSHYEVKTFVNVQRMPSEELRSFCRTSEWKYKISLGIVLKGSNGTGNTIKEYASNDDPVLGKYIQTCKTRMKALINSISGGYENYLERFCNVYQEEREDNYYINCEGISITPGHKGEYLSMNTIKTQLLNSVIHIELALDHITSYIIGIFSLVNPQMSGKFPLGSTFTCLNSNSILSFFGEKTEERSMFMLNDMQMKYSLSLNKVHNYKWEVSLNVTENNRPHNSSYLIAFPMLHRYLFFNSNETSKQLKINKNIVRGNINFVGMNVYVIAFDYTMDDFFQKKASLGEDMMETISSELKKFKTGDGFEISQCSIMEEYHNMTSDLINIDRFSTFSSFSAIDQEEISSWMFIEILISICIAVVIIIIFLLRAIFKRKRVSEFQQVATSASGHQTINAASNSLELV